MAHSDVFVAFLFHFYLFNFPELFSSILFLFSFLHAASLWCFSLPPLLQLEPHIGNITGQMHLSHLTCGFSTFHLTVLSQRADP